MIRIMISCHAFIFVSLGLITSCNETGARNDRINSLYDQRIQTVIGIIDSACTKTFEDYKRDSSGITNYVVLSINLINSIKETDSLKKTLIEKIKADCIKIGVEEILVRNNGVIELILSRTTTLNNTIVQEILFDPYFEAKLVQEDSDLKIIKCEKIRNKIWLIKFKQGL